MQNIKKFFGKDKDCEGVKLNFELVKRHISEASDFIQELENTNLSISISEELKASDIGASLVSLQNHLSKIAIEEEERNWVNVGLAKFSDILRNKASLNLEELTYDILANLIKYVNANQGALFVIEQENNNDSHLEMVACYAFDRRKHISKRIELGEGLAGQCALEQEQIYITDVPKNYINITSGLGDAPPRCVFISPLIVNDQIYGVIEMASFEVLPQYKIEFINRLSENIASTIKNVKDSERTQSLLEASQIQTEQLRAQEEEMRQNMEELAATQEAIEAEKINMQGLLNTVNAYISMVEFWTDGIIIDANDIFLQSMGYTLSEIAGKHHSMFLTPDFKNSNEYSKFWDNLASGKTINAEALRVTKSGREIWLQAVYSPVRDNNGTIVKVIKLATDISQSKNMQVEAMQQAEMLRAQEEEMRQNMEELQTTQEELAKSYTEIEEIRRLEKERAETQISSQKKIMEQYMMKTKEKEESFKQRVKELEQQLAIFTGNGSTA